MDLSHVTIAARGGAPFALDEATRRAVVRAVARRGQQLLFGAVDDHLHSVADARPPRLFARGLRRGVQAAVRSSVRLEAPHVSPVERRSHLERLVRYVLGQPAKHGLPEHPALWTGSCFLDLIGARVLDGFDAGLLRRHLPRLRKRVLFEAVGLDPVDLEPADRGLWERVGPGRLVDLAGAVFAAPPDLRGNTDVVVRARALAAHAARRVDVPTRALAEALEVSDRAVRNLARREVDPRALRAIGVRLALEERVAAVGGSRRPSGDEPPGRPGGTRARGRAG